MKIFIRNMVSLRCKLLVKSELDNLAIRYSSIELGEVAIPDNLSAKKQQLLKEVLLRSGLEVLDDGRAILIERIKNLIVEMVHYTDEVPLLNFSSYLSQKLNLSYHYLSNVFSETKGITIEHYVILHKIERVKELLIYDELTLTEISYKLNYSSVAHLSSQFKKITGLTPTFFKSLKHQKRNLLEEL